ncbi:hypothetical protein DFP72DRAFT_855558 [Ephemerocybe angulata]|uniref:F-box domain-containing protein n=1 Tax=Ephemerocybe angulata TaxID=980116 RepID=A0A8H6LZ15_9AGAR|nr:hypothetical protein DFP72DRAFT_855558 [Tulosesus angulatus]
MLDVQPALAAKSRTTGSKPGFLSLPYDLLLNIASYLSFDDVHNLHLVSKSLHDFSKARPVYRKLATDLLRRCRALPLKGFQQLSDLTTDQLIRSVNKATRYEMAWRKRAPRPITAAPSSNYMDGEGDSWYKVVRAPPDEDVDWLSPITSSYTLCATKRGKVVCWDVQTDRALAEWNPGEKWELWKCRVEFEQRAVFFTMAKVILGQYNDDRVMEFILMRLTFSDGPSGETSTTAPPLFSHVTDFRTSGVVMNVFLLDPSTRLLSAFIWVSSSNTIGLYTLPDWDKLEYVFIDTGIECVISSNWSCILFEDNIVIHCEEAEEAYQHFYPLSMLRKHSQRLASSTSVPSLSQRLPAARTISKKFKFPALSHIALPGRLAAPSADAFTDGVLPNPFPVPPWYPESAHFVRQWWPTLPGTPRVSCTVVLLAATDPVTRRSCFVLAQHYFRVPINHAEWYHPETCKCGSFEEGSESDMPTPQCEWAKGQLTMTQKALIAQDEALMHMWYVSTPFEVVRVLERSLGDAGEEDLQDRDRPRPLVAVDFGHAVWIEYCDDTPAPRANGEDGGDTELEESDEKRLRFVSFPPFRDESEFMGMDFGDDEEARKKALAQEVEGRVKTLEIPDELDLGTIETINIDQSQGAIILSDRDGKIYILCYE